MRTRSMVRVSAIAACLLWGKVSLGVLPPHASTLNDICPGTPDPCDVTGKFLISDGIMFDLGGRALHLKGTASLGGVLGAKWTIKNASAITLDKGTYLASNGFDQTAGNVTITNGGACAFNGRMQVNGAKANAASVLGGAGGNIDITCDSIDLGASSWMEANGKWFDAGSITLLATTGTITGLKGAKFQALGDAGNPGGSVSIVAYVGSCVLPVTIETEGRPYVDPTTGERADGPGGLVTLACGGDLTLDKGAKITASSFRGALRGIVQLSGVAVTVEESVPVVNNGLDGGGGGGVTIEASGAVAVKKGSQLTANSQGGMAGEINVTSPGTCTVNGTLAANGYADRPEMTGGTGGGVTVECEGLGIETKGHVTAVGYPFVDIPNEVFNGGDGGTISLSGGAGAFDMPEGAVVSASGSVGQGGHVTVGADGNCTIAGTVSGYSGAVHGQTLGAGDVNVSCIGDVTIAGSARITAGATIAKDAPGGFISITAGDGDVMTAPSSDVTIHEGAKLVSDGVEGDLTLGADGDCFVDGTLSSDGKLGVSASIAVSCLAGEFNLGPKGVLSTESSGGSAGTIACSAAGMGQLDGKVVASGTTLKDLINGDTVGGGGTITMDFDGLTVNDGANVRALGLGADSDGGSITLASSSESAIVFGKIEAGGNHDGGSITVTGPSGVSVSDDILAPGGKGHGGSIALIAGVSPTQVTADVFVEKSLNVGGYIPGAGDITLTGCNVTVDTAGSLKANAAAASSGPGGINHLNAHNALTINGLVSALGGLAGTPGMNDLHYGTSYSIASPVASHLKPLATAVNDLTACP